MKLATTILLTLLTSYAFASDEKVILSCTVPADTTTPTTLNVTLTEDTSADFVKATLSEPNQQPMIYFSQVEKGQISGGLSKGSLAAILVSEASNQENGIVSNAGFMAFSKGNEGNFSGFLFAKGNLYTLSCEAH